MNDDNDYRVYAINKTTSKSKICEYRKIAIFRYYDLWFNLNVCDKKKGL